MSRHRWLAIATSLSIILAACSNNLPQNSTQLGTPTKLGTVEFAEGLSVRALSEFLGTSKLDVEYALFTQTVAGEETVGGILLEDKDLSKLEGTLQKGTEAFIADMALTDTKGGKFKVLAGQAATAVAAPRITGITGDFSQTDITKLRSDKRVSRLLFGPENPQASSTVTDVELETQVDRGPGKLWVPIRGRVYLLPSATGYQNRFATAQMTFSGNYFARNDGYEHDLKMNNYTGTSLPGTYFSLAVAGTGARKIPKVEEWRTSWPASSRPYLDNRFGDGVPPEEPAYTIGMVYANQIVANVNYYTYIRIAKGTANSDNAKLYAIKTEGRYSGGRCWSQWCMFEYQSRNIYSAWRLGAPTPSTGRSWYFTN